MHLRYITCSDPREHIPVDDIIGLLVNNPLAEIAVQAHPTKMSFGMPRNEWFDEVVRKAVLFPDVHLAIHINMDWANMMACGIWPAEIAKWRDMRNIDNKPVIGRYQINIHGSKTPEFREKSIHRMIKENDAEFIIQYAQPQFERVSNLNLTGAKFSVLYDASGGQGLSPDSWEKPLFEHHPQGYSGGISPDNVADVLTQINRMVGKRNDVWIDAEGKLKNPDTKKFDMDLAYKYISNAIKWQQRQR